MTPDAVDYSFSRANAAQLQAAGIKLASRYLSHSPAKNLSTAEAADLHAHHIDILLNWESDAGRPLLGAGAGDSDGRDAAALAESLGASRGCTIYYSCDRDVNSSEWDTIAAYYRAAGQATAGHYKVGMYGEADAVDEMHRRGLITSEWQSSAWSNGRLSANTDLYQFLNGQTLAGASVDFDKIIHSDSLGAWRWNPAGITPKGPLMALSDAEQSELLADVRAINARLGKIDTMSYAVLNSILPAVSDMRPSMQAVYGVVTDGNGGLVVRVAALQAALDALATQVAHSGGTVDMPAVLKAAHDGAVSALNGAKIVAA